MQQTYFDYYYGGRLNFQVNKEETLYELCDNASPKCSRFDNIVYFAKHHGMESYYKKYIQMEDRTLEDMGTVIPNLYEYVRIMAFAGIQSTVSRPLKPRLCSTTPLSRSATAFYDYSEYNDCTESVNVRYERRKLCMK